MDDNNFIDLGDRIIPFPRWNGRTILDLEDQHLIQILRGLQRLAEIKRRAIKWAYCEMLEEGVPSMKPVLEGWKNEVRDRDWTHYVEPIFRDLESEAQRRGLNWDTGLDVDREIDMSNRGPLERQIVGALRDCVNAHGPITKDIAHSAAKRVVGAIKTYNRKVRKP